MSVIVQELFILLISDILTSKGTFELIMDENKAGSCLWITNRRGFEYWPTPSEEAKYLVNSSGFRKRSEFKAPQIKLPENFEKVFVFQNHLFVSSILTIYVHASSRLTLFMFDIGWKMLFRISKPRDHIMPFAFSWDHIVWLWFTCVPFLDMLPHLLLHFLFSKQSNLQE